MQPAEELMMLVARTCERLKLSYYVTGSVASMAGGEPRLTQDVDMVVELPSWKVHDFCIAFPAPAFYVSEDAAFAGVQAGSMFNVIDVAAGVKADIIPFRDTPFDESRLSRARRIDLADSGTVMMSAPEDIILKKLEFYREGGSDKHLRDISGMVRVSGADLDLGYIDHWSLRIGVGAQWKAMREKLGIR